MSDWFNNFKNRFNKTAVDKLPDEELDNGLPPVDNSAQDASAVPVQGDSEAPLVWNNKYLVKTDNTEFMVELNPRIMTQDEGQIQGGPQDQQTNPNANPALLDEWLESGKPASKPFASNEQGTIDPLSREEEQDPKVQVHKQANINLIAEDIQEGAGQTTPPVSPGANKSNPYPPCKYCANYIAETGECTQGLDVEKVQAAKSCSWLNANMSPFGKPKDPDPSHKDSEIFNSDITNSQNGENASMQQNIQNRASKEKIKDYFKGLWT